MEQGRKKASKQKTAAKPSRAKAPSWFTTSFTGSLTPLLKTIWNQIQEASKEELETAFARLAFESTLLEAPEFLPKTARGMRTWFGKADDDLYRDKIDSMFRVSFYLDKKGGEKLLRKALTDGEAMHRDHLELFAIQHCWSGEECEAFLRQPKSINADFRNPVTIGYRIGHAIADRDEVANELLENLASSYVGQLSGANAKLDYLLICCIALLRRDQRKYKPRVEAFRDGQLANADKSWHPILKQSFKTMLRGA